MPTRRLLLFATSLLLGCFLNPAKCSSDGTRIITIANVTDTCLDTSKYTVDFWLLSARVPRDSNFFNTTNAIGAKVVVTLTGEGQKPSFPIARQISTSDLRKDSKIERVYLGMPVLSQYNLWNDSNPSSPVETTNLDFPVVFVRTQGTSAPVQVMNALINFTQSANALIPPNPYTQGAVLVGQLTNSLGNIFKNNKDVDAPDFQLSFSTSHSTTCNPQNPQEGIGAEIRDYNGTVDKGFISVDNVANYCFYKQGDDRDPDIVFIQKSGATCSKDFPASGTKPLANPLFIWTANATCKTDNGCPQQTPPPPSRVSALAAKVTDPATLKTLLEDRLGKDSSEKLINILTNKNSESVSSLNSKEANTLHSLSTCASVGISPERCLSSKP